MIETRIRGKTSIRNKRWIYVTFMRHYHKQDRENAIFQVFIYRQSKTSYRFPFCKYLFALPR